MKWRNETIFHIGHHTTQILYLNDIRLKREPGTRAAEPGTEQQHKKKPMSSINNKIIHRAQNAERSKCIGLDSNHLSDANSHWQLPLFQFPHLSYQKNGKEHVFLDDQNPKCPYCCNSSEMLSCHTTSRYSWITTVIRNTFTHNEK